VAALVRPRSSVSRARVSAFAGRGDVIADPGERVDHRFHLIEHAIDDDREL